MTEEQQHEEESKSEQAEKPEGVVEVKESKFRGLHSQLKQQKAELEELRAFRSEIEEARKAEAEKQAKEAGEYQRLLDERDKTIAELMSEHQTLVAAKHQTDIRNALINAGMDPANEEQLDGTIMRLSGSEDIDDAVSKYKEQKPYLFARPVMSYPANRVGKPQSSAGDWASVYADRDQNKDTAKKRAAHEMIVDFVRKHGHPPPK